MRWRRENEQRAGNLGGSSSVKKENSGKHERLGEMVLIVLYYIALIAGFLGIGYLSYKQHGGFSWNGF